MVQYKLLAGVPVCIILVNCTCTSCFTNLWRNLAHAVGDLLADLNNVLAFFYVVSYSMARH
jgi:hypothetical protein